MGGKKEIYRDVWFFTEPFNCENIVFVLTHILIKCDCELCYVWSCLHRILLKLVFMESRCIQCASSFTAAYLQL